MPVAVGGVEKGRRLAFRYSAIDFIASRAAGPGKYTDKGDRLSPSRRAKS